MASKRDYYEVLGVPRSATSDEVKKAYRRLARTHHPDVNRHDKAAEEKFKEINEAYEILSDPQKRGVYDRFGHSGPSGGFGQADFDYGRGFGFGDIFDVFFGSGGFNTGEAARERPISQRGTDLRADVELTLEEVATGAEKTVRLSRMETCESCTGSGAAPGSQPETCSTCHGAGQVRRQQTGFFGTSITVGVCPRCHGEGRVIQNPCKECGGDGRVRSTAKIEVKVPAGVDSDNRVRLSGEGDAGIRGGPTGDLYVFPHVRQHPIFERRGNDIWCELSVSFAQASLGATVEASTLDGKEKLHLAEGTQSGEVYRLRDRGIPSVNGHGKGSLNVAIKVETPTKLSGEERKLLQQFADMRGENLDAEPEKSFFEKVKDAFSGR
ncbi:MAG: molecular chaperone DnaJ [Armatimonadota bacterium]|nr:molecular chaperone DnaJ [Armatimonadota bacterium]